MTKCVAETDLYMCQKSNPEWIYWLHYDRQHGWEVYGEPFILKGDVS